MGKLVSEEKVLLLLCCEKQELSVSKKQLSMRSSRSSCLKSGNCHRREHTSQRRVACFRLMVKDKDLMRRCWLVNGSVDQMRLML